MTDSARFSPQAVLRAIRLTATLTMMLAIWHGWRTLHRPVQGAEGS